MAGWADFYWAGLVSTCYGPFKAALAYKKILLVKNVNQTFELKLNDLILV